MATRRRPEGTVAETPGRAPARRRPSSTATAPTSRPGAARRQGRRRSPRSSSRRRFHGRRRQGVEASQPRRAQQDWIATDGSGDEWLALVAGASTVVRNGLRRSDVLFRTLGEASVLTAAGHRVLVLTTDLPPNRSAPLTALAEARGRSLVDASSWVRPVWPPGCRCTPPVACTRRSASCSPASDPGSPCRPPRPRSPRSSPAARSPARRRSRQHSRKGSLPRWAPPCGPACRSLHVEGQHRQEFAAAWANGKRLPRGRRGAAGHRAEARRVEGPHAGAR